MLELGKLRLPEGLLSWSMALDRPRQEVLTYQTENESFEIN